MKTWFRSAAILLLATFVAIDADAQMRMGKLGVGVGGSMYQYYGDDYTLVTPKFGGAVSVTYNPFEYIGFRSLIGFGQFGYKVTSGSNALAPAGGESYTQLMSANFYVSGNLMPSGRVNPFVTAGVGYTYFDPRTNGGLALISGTGAKYDIALFFGGGVDYFLSEFISISASGEYCLANSDLYDGVTTKSGNDAYLRGGIEIRYYFFDQGFMTKMLEALKARYE